MRISSNDEQKSTEQFLIYLGMAIDEARFARLTLGSAEREGRFVPDNGLPENCCLSTGR